MSAVAILPTPPNVEDAFETYAALVRAAEDSPSLKLSPDHNIAIARAWQNWRDIYLEWDRRCK